jgi:hypothetical protein
MKPSFLIYAPLLLLVGCSKPKTEESALATALKKAEAHYSPFLPKMSDDETRLDSVKASPTELRFESTFVHTEKSELGASPLEPELRVELTKQAQSLENLNQLLKQGATLVYSYKDKRGVHVAEVRVGPDAAITSRDHLEEPLNAAKLVYDRYVQHVCNFDAGLAELYAEEALIRMTRKYPDGTSQTKTVPSGRHKQFVQTIMPIAKQRGDTCRFSEAQYEQAGEDKVRIKVKQYSDLGKYWSDVSLMVVKVGDKWLITEDLTVSEIPTNDKK